MRPINGLRRQGDERGDGLVFDAYRPDGGELWLRPDAFHRKRVITANCAARRRAKRKAVPFDIDTDYLLSIFPADRKCPALGIEMVWGGTERMSSPSLDRLEPSKGYVRGNVQWLSHRANTIKTNATTAQICAVADFLRKSTTDVGHQF